MVEADFKNARNLAPGRYDVEIKWAYWWNSQGNLDEAEIQARALLQAYPEMPELYLLLIQIYVAQGDLPSAEKVVSAAKMHFPESPQFSNLLDGLRRQP
jgi:tetratricopeptide (TPR) repeat protein